MPGLDDRKTNKVPAVDATSTHATTNKAKARTSNTTSNTHHDRDKKRKTDACVASDAERSGDEEQMLPAKRRRQSAKTREQSTTRPTPHSIGKGARRHHAVTPTETATGMEPVASNRQAKTTRPGTVSDISAETGPAMPSFPVKRAKTSKEMATSKPQGFQRTGMFFPTLDQSTWWVTQFIQTIVELDGSDMILPQRPGDRTSGEGEDEDDSDGDDEDRDPTPHPRDFPADERSEASERKHAGWSSKEEEMNERAKRKKRQYESSIGVSPQLCFIDDHGNINETSKNRSHQPPARPPGMSHSSEVIQVM